MLASLLNDLALVPDVEILITRDKRLMALPCKVDTYWMDPQEDVWMCWERCIVQCDAVWPIAPESGGALERLSRMALDHGKCLLGSSPQAVAVTASKSATLTQLAAAGVPVVPTWRASDLAVSEAGPWVAKPDDGVGCEDARLFQSVEEMSAWLAQGGRWSSHVVQPLIAGEAASLSMLCRDGQAWLMSCNRQLVRLRQGEFEYMGSELNGMARYWNDFSVLASTVAGAIPGLAGYAGVDVMVCDDGLKVLEVNPRLTTSYAGLHRAAGANPAWMVLDLLYNHTFNSLPDLARNVVTISLNE